MHKVPKYRHFKARGIGFVEWKGQRIYFNGAPYNSAESIKAYREFIEKNCELKAPTALEVAKPKVKTSLCIAELADRFLDYAHGAFRGAKETEFSNYRRILNILVDRYGELNIEDFGPKRLTEFQNWLAETDHLKQSFNKKGELVRSSKYRLTRNTVNHMIGNVKRLFKWGVAEELVKPMQLVGLQAVRGLRVGRTTARESVPREGVRWEAVERILPILSPVVADMVRFQWHTGCRPQNVCNICPAEIDTTTSPWTWKPRTHKGNWRGHGLELFIGPQAQEIIKPYLDRWPESKCFSPREARQRKLESLGRKVESGFGHLKTHYTPSTYGRAIIHGLAQLAEKPLRPPYSRAKFFAQAIEYWTPHQLRHAKAQALRNEFGLEAAQAVLGHNTLAATQIYAKKRSELAKELAEKCG